MFGAKNLTYGIDCTLFVCTPITRLREHGSGRQSQMDTKLPRTHHALDMRRGKSRPMTSVASDTVYITWSYLSHVHTVSFGWWFKRILASWPISITCSSEIPKSILMKLEHANPGGAVTTWVVGTDTWLVTCFLFRDIYIFSYTWNHRFWWSITWHKVFPHKEVSFGVALTLLPILTVKSPKTLDVIKYFKAWIAKYKKKLLHRFQPNVAQW